MITVKLVSLLRPLMTSPVKTFWPWIGEVDIIIEVTQEQRHRDPLPTRPRSPYVLGFQYTP